MYKVGDKIELIYKDSLGTGEIIKINEGFFSTKYLVKVIITQVWFLRVEETYEKVLILKEKDIIKKLD